MSRCFHWRIHKLQRIHIDFANLFRKLADNRVLSSSLFKVGMILMPNQPKRKEKDSQYSPRTYMEKTQKY